jgi:hypothetical protein
MDIQTINSKIVAVQDQGGAVGAADLIQRNTVKIHKYRAEADALEAQNAALLSEAKKQQIGELTKEEKIKLVSTGVKLAKDFPGDDWLVDYQI